MEGKYYPGQSSAYRGTQNATQPRTPIVRIGSEKGGAMSTAALTINVWNLEYYQTMRAAERARLTVARTQQYAVPQHIRFVAEVFLWYPFFAVTRDVAKLVSLLEKIETYPAYILLDEDAERIPQELEGLFKRMCRVIQKTEVVGLRDGRLLRNNINKWSELSQQIKGYADRFADAQEKLRSRVPAEQVQNYQESFAAYGSCEPSSIEFTSDDEKKTLLRF
jgi:hypothetical protein